MSQTIRCDWCLSSDLYINYHDNVWGVPEFDDKLLFEYICLEGAQAGLSWLTILKKQQNYKKAFLDFDSKKIANFDDKIVEEIITNADVVRNRLKIKSVIKNARIIQENFSDQDSFSNFIWKHVNFKPINHSFTELSQIPTQDNIALSLSKDLKKLGFSFVGPTICYAFMQAIGMVNDHLINCSRYQEISELTF